MIASRGEALVPVCIAPIGWIESSLGFLCLKRYDNPFEGGLQRGVVIDPPPPCPLSPFSPSPFSPSPVFACPPYRRYLLVFSCGPVQDRLIRCYLVAFGLGGVLAELDTPFAKANFRAMQKWWFKAPFYVL